MNKLVDFCLGHRDNIERAINDKLEDSDTPKTGGGSSQHAFVSDPTCQKAIKRVMPVGPVYVEYGPKVCGKCGVKLLKNPELWLRAVDLTWKVFNGTQSHKVMVARYHQGKEYKEIAKDMRISYQRVYIIMSSVHKYCYDVAKANGALVEHNPRTEAIMEKIRGKENVITKETETIYTI